MNILTILNTLSFVPEKSYEESFAKFLLSRIFIVNYIVCLVMYGEFKTIIKLEL